MVGVISIPSDLKWKSGTVEATDFGDQNFQFLSEFEEMLPEDYEQYTKKPKGKNKKEDPKIVMESQKDEEANDSTVVEKKKKKRKKKKKAKKSQVVTIVNGEGNIETSDDIVSETKKETDDSSAEGKMKTNKKRKPKRKSNEDVKVEEDEEAVGSKKVRFGKEPTKSVQKDEEKDCEDVKPIEEEDHIDVKEPVDVSAWSAFFLPDVITKAISHMGFATPTEIQRLVLPLAVRDRIDVLGAAETGSGKTLAFAIPVLCRLIEEEREGEGPRALVLAPTRELVVQIMKTFTALCKFTQFSAVSIVGGLADVKQLRVMSQRKPEVIVATPGRLWDLLRKAEDDSYLSDFTGLNTLVVDETDRMVEQGHFKEMRNILEAVRTNGSEKLQTLVFSATLTYVLPNRESESNKRQQKTLTAKQKIRNDKDNVDFTESLMEATGLNEKHKVVDITRTSGTAEKLIETRINCEGLVDKDTHVLYLLNRYKGRTLIFTNSIDASRRLYGVLNIVKHQPAPLMLHAHMQQRQRLRNLERFTAEANSVLLATDVAARGLDIKGIEHVIHYQIPKTTEIYIHRSGRTARACQSGLTVLMVDPKDAHLYRRICSNLNRQTDLPVFPIDAENLRDSLFERVELASKLDTLAYRCKKIRLNESWFEKTAREADLEIDDRDREREGVSREVDTMMREQDQLKAKLRVALAKPLPNLARLAVGEHRTKYITPELASKYNQCTSMKALDKLDERLEESRMLKKKSRKAAKTQSLKMK